MNKLCILSFLIVAQFLFACQEENDPILEKNKDTQRTQSIAAEPELIKVDSVEVTADGALNFLSPAAYAKAVKQLVNQPYYVLDLWESGIGFNSMRKTVKKLMDDAYDLTGQSEKWAIVNQHPDLVKIGQRGEIKPLIEAAFFRNILNEASQFYVAGDLYKVTEDSVFITKKEDLLKGESDRSVYSIPYCEKKIDTRAPDPNKNSLNSMDGRYTQILTNVSGSANEIWLETTYKVYRNVIGIAYSFPPYSIGDNHRVTSDYYIQFDIYQWLYNNSTRNWSYYKPEYELYISNIRYKHRWAEGEALNSILGQPNEYQFTYSHFVVKAYETVSKHLFDEVMPPPQAVIDKVPLQGLVYLYYKIGNSQYRNGIDIGYHQN